MTEHFSLWSYLFWIVGASLELLILRAWFHRKALPHLTMLPAFVGFVLFADIVRFAILQSGAFGKFGYAYSWWYAQVLESLLRSLLAIQILSHVLPKYRHRVTLWSCYAAFWIITVFALGIPTDVTRVFVRMLTVADFIGGLLVGFAIIWPSIHWPRGYTTAAFALFFSLVADVALFIVRFSTGTQHLTLLRVLFPGSFIVALLLFLSATMIGRRDTDTGKVGKGKKSGSDVTELPGNPDSSGKGMGRSALDAA